MQRDLSRFIGKTFDLIVIGAGVHGACVARDAALRGLSVALIDQGDLCGATSHNSLKTIHGGIRYLQHLNFKRTLECINEQKYWLRTAPHLIKPLPFLMPTYGHGARGPEAMWCGIKMYETMGIGRNRSIPEYRRIPNGKVISKAECLKLAPGISVEGLTGGAIWYDAQAENTDRAVIEIAQSAAENGACVANYLRADNLIIDQKCVRGIHVSDQISGDCFDIHGELVINAAGPWAAQWLTRNQENLQQQHHLPLTKSMNIVTRQLLPEHAIGIQSSQASDSVVGSSKRLYFIVPWQDRSMVGTTHFHYDGAINTLSNERETMKQEIQQFIDEINQAYPDINLALDDVIYCYHGLTPANEPSQHANATRLHHSKVIDHADNDAIDGLISIISIKWTTARLIAEKVTDLAAKKLSKLNKHIGPCKTRTQVFTNAKNPLSSVNAQTSDEDLIRFCKRCINEEMTLSLTDLLLRRTDAVMRNNLSIEQIRVLAQTLSDSLNWTANEQQQQLSQLQHIWLAPELQQQLTNEFLWS
ncbi:MAG: FAD-dependent oxidoreductase [Arenicella sp.]